jgi:hypothetical protein
VRRERARPERGRGARCAGGGGTALPTASGAGQVPLSAGAGTTYTATSAGDVVDAAIASVVGAVAGQAIVGDGLGGVTETSADVSAVLAAANNAAARAALGFPALSTALYVLRMNAAGTAMEFAAAAGDTMTIDRSWSRPAPESVASGTRFLSQDDLSVQISTGVAASAGVDASGWVQDLPTRLGPDRCGLQPGVLYASSINLSAYAIGAMTMVVLFKPSGTMSGGALYCLGALGDSTAGSRGCVLFCKENGGNIDIVAYGGSGSVATTIVSSAFTAASTALHAVAVAAVNATGHKWRVSVDGSAVADVAMGANYVTPTSTDSFGFGSRSSGANPFSGQVIDLMVWNSTVSSANMALLTTLPGTPTYALPESASTGAATIRCQASRFDPSFPTALPVRGLPGGAALVCSGLAKVSF